MPVREPGWWYGADSAGRANMLAPVERLWSWVALRRIARTVPVRSSLPIICVGNFTAGGTGKTPLSIFVAERLMLSGERPVFLTRGYGGRVSGPHRVNPALDTAADVGDEPLLLARFAPVIIARDRVAGAQLAASDAGVAPPTVVIMDDGLQNAALAKDLTLAVVDASRGLGNGRVIPAGPLRAPLDAQFAIADAIIVNAAPGTAPARAHETAEYLRSRFPGPVIETRVEAGANIKTLAGTRVLALAGIANPGRFFAMLEAAGAEIAYRAEFKDHHAFSESDAAGIIAKAASIDARIVTTEKDYVRLPAHGATGRGATGQGGEAAGGKLAELREKAMAIPIRVALEPRDESRLASLIDAAMLARRKQTVKP